MPLESCSKFLATKAIVMVTALLSHSSERGNYPVFSCVLILGVAWCAVFISLWFQRKLC